MSPRRAPSADEIAAIAQAELARIPRELRRFVANVAIRVEDLPDEETEREMALESPFDLLGLYHGVALDEQSVADVRHDVDYIVLYRRPILDYWCETGETLESIVRHVLIHEIGHHFGFSDEDMERLESEG
ncbi:MAG TPA: metallopeptidase family protein [Alphaproteobacteria bacterium]|nr:metallopeptidase family protein [Alphaproteobacteria bacterium]